MKRILAVLVLVAGVARAGFEDAPTNWIAGYSCDGTNITLPLSNFPQLSTNEANGVNGDIRAVVSEVTEKFYAMFLGVASTNRPAKCTLSRQGQETSSGATSILIRTYGVQVNLVTTNLNVEGE